MDATVEPLTAAVEPVTAAVEPFDGIGATVTEPVAQVVDAAVSR